MIGNQCWMAHNLNVDTFNNGDPIPLIENDQDWQNQSPIIFGGSKAASCYYNNAVNPNIPYGRLYNWHAVIDPRQLAPEGWRISTVQDWEELFKFLGVTFYEKIMDDQYWDPKKISWLDKLIGYKIPIKDFANTSGISLLPGGQRDEYGNFFGLKERAYFWCANEDIVGDPYHLEIDGYRKAYSNSYYTGNGNSVRCIKI